MFKKTEPSHEGEEKPENRKLNTAIHPFLKHLGEGHLLF